MDVRAAALAAVVAAALFVLGAQGAVSDPSDILARDLGFSAKELADVARGRVARHTIDTEAPGEVAAAGAVRIAASPDAFIERLRDIANFKRNENVLQIGRFSDPPTLEDLAALTIDDEDFEGRKCRVGDCPVRLPADEIRRLQREIDWKAPDARSRGAALFKLMVLEQVKAYWGGGAGRFVQFDDGKRPIRPQDEFLGVLAASAFLGDLVPGLPEHLRRFPAVPLSDAEDFLYWSKESFGIAPFVTVTHVTIAHAAPGTFVITSKDVYSSRYFDASLGVAVVVPVAGGFDLAYMNRSRANALKGGLSGLRRALVERRMRGGLEESLQAVRGLMEGTGGGRRKR